MLKPRRRRLKAISFNSLIPNMLTVLAFCAGMTAVRFSMEGRWEAAVLAIVAAAVLDGLDGRMARLLKGTSKFGAELDSLSDFVAFGVVPALVMYHWTLHQLGGLGWIAALAFATCCGLRLARFNTELEDPDQPAWSNQFFKGVAAPVGGLFGIFPLVLSFLLGDGVVREPAVVAVWMIVWAFMMISAIPTYSFKRVRVKRDFVVPVLVVAGLIAAALVSYPWIALSCIAVGYLVLIPFSIFSHRRLSLETEARKSLTEEQVTEYQPPADAPETDSAPSQDSRVVPLDRS